MTFTALAGYSTPSLEHTTGEVELRGLSGAAHFIITVRGPLTWYWTRGAGVIFSDRFQLSFDDDPTPSYQFQLERGTGTYFFLIPTPIEGGGFEIDAGVCSKLGSEPFDRVNCTFSVTPGASSITGTVPSTWTWN